MFTAISKNTIFNFFKPHDSFNQNEWILKHKISALMLVYTYLGIGIFAFATYHMISGRTLVGLIQYIFVIFLYFGFTKVKQNKNLYHNYALATFWIFFIYMIIIFFLVPDNKLNVLWLNTSPVLIFFFLDKKGGISVYLLLILFVIYLLLSGYAYTLPEFITLIAALTTTTIVMYINENVKNGEKERLLSYNEILQHEVNKQTRSLQDLNNTLEVRVKKEVSKQLMQEQMLLQQSRMANMGEMVDAIAHQWRQPLMNINAVLMNLNRGIERSQKTDSLTPKVLEIFTLTSHMSQTIEDFRSLLKEGKEKENFNLLDVVNEVLYILKHTLKNINVVININANIYIKNYKNEFFQVLIILINNAQDALIGNHILDKKIIIEVIEKHENVIIHISDNAKGIQEKDISKIFDPYYTTKMQSGGTGLGLYIAKIIIEQNMHGMLKFKNIDNGACFSIIVSA